MDRFILSSPVDIDRLRAALAQTRQLFEVRRTDGEADWQATSGVEPFDWNAPTPLTGAKRFFFPPREPLLSWVDDAVAETKGVAAPFVLFGLRSCDLVAIAYQDQFFAGDPWYTRRRDAAFLVGLNCLQACPTGFCHDVAAGPFAGVGFDLNLTRLPDASVVVETGSRAGADTLEAASLSLRTIDKAGEAAFEAALRGSIASFPERRFLAPAIERIGTAPDLRATDPGFADLGPSCLACTGCSNLCPTCSCFTVVDEVAANGGTRSRCWDSCLLEGFQREASGHHPAPHSGDRVYRFWYHKFGAPFREQFGRVGCVGCGRCDITCPGSIGALKVLEQVAKWPA